VTRHPDVALESFEDGIDIPDAAEMGVLLDFLTSDDPRAAVERAA